MIDKTKGRIEIDLKLPGFLVIDTPGHESFTNLRSRGSSLCDIAILVVDIMHGLEQQTLESMDLLRQKKCPFIVALNKCDRVYQWKSVEYNNFRDSLDAQQPSAQNEFKDRCEKTILRFAEQGMNTLLYWENEDTEDFVSLCPTSAITGEGLPDLLTYLCVQCQTRIPKQLYEKTNFECTVLEVKIIEGLGTTIDVVLLNGILKISDTIILQGLTGPIVTQIRALLTPHPMKEMRVKNEYIHHQSIKGAMGIKISAPGLEQAIAGAELLRANGQKEIDAAVEEIEGNMYDIMDKFVDKNSDGVCVQASTIGSLEALL
jgi:translation initiation factor 5B